MLGLALVLLPLLTSCAPLPGDLAKRLEGLERYTTQLEQRIGALQVEIRQRDKWQAWQLIKKESAKKRVEAEG